MNEPKVLTLGVPAGIGDISWLYSKLHCADGHRFVLNVADGWPHRSVEFCRLLPKVDSSAYKPFNYEDIMLYQRQNGFRTFKEVAECGFGQIYLAPNEHLEQGCRLEDWLPDLRTDFHYPLNTNSEHAELARGLVEMAKDSPGGGSLIGVSAASYRGSEAWDTWRSRKWERFLDLVQEIVGKQATFVLMGGFWDDLTYALSKRSDSFEVVGKTSVGAAYELLRRLDGYIGFSSGLGVMGTLLRKPVFMLWPKHQIELSMSWAPPEMLREHSYVASQWLEPFEVAQLAEPWLRRWVMKEVS